MVRVYIRLGLNNIFVSIFNNQSLVYKDSIKRVNLRLKLQRSIETSAFYMGSLVSSFISSHLSYSVLCIFFRGSGRPLFYFAKGLKRQDLGLSFIFFSSRLCFNGCKLKKRRRL